MLPTRGDLLAALPVEDADLVPREHGFERVDALLDQTGPGVRAGDAERPDLFRPVADVADVTVTEIKAEEVTVSGLRFGRLGNGRAPNTGFRCAFDTIRMEDPIADGRAGDAGLSTHLADGEPGSVKGGRLPADMA
ncbi:hypothetical protein GCM10022205_09710 [Spinactinospora alkalitolerans]